MKITSDGLDKAIKLLEKEKETYYRQIRDRSTYVVAVTEDAGALSPDFDLLETVSKIGEIDAKVVIMRHARNEFNAVTVLPNAQLTIDKALVRMAQLTTLISSIKPLTNRLTKERNSGMSALRSKEIEYTYTNYDVEEANELYTTLTKEQMTIQTDLNLVNTTVAFEVAVEL